MGNWYFDRAKSFYHANFDEEINFFLTNCENVINSNELEELIKKSNIEGLKGTNIKAKLSHYRDIGVINMQNKIGNSILEYREGILDLPTLILDLIIRRPTNKEEFKNKFIRPFVVICKFFNILIDMGLDKDDIFLTINESIDYLSKIDNYDKLDYDLVEEILENRTLNSSKIERDSNDIQPYIFDALGRMPIFFPFEKERIYPNIEQKAFFSFVASNYTDMDTKIVFNIETNDKLYDYYIKKGEGISKMLPKVVNHNLDIEYTDSLVEDIFSYLFGYSMPRNFSYQKYFKFPCFGIYFPFITIPRIPIREIYYVNEKLGKKLLDYISKKKYNFNENEMFKSENGIFINSKKNFRKNNDESIQKIFFGAPGTGKSYTLNKAKDKLLESGGSYERVTFHPDYSYNNFVGTYKPVPEKDENNKNIITYKYVPGPFMRIYVEALKNPQKPCLLIIEEINRANIAAVFGDIFQLLDRSKDDVSEYPIQASEDIKKYLFTELGGFPKDYFEIKIPSNMFIWATMNSADQGVFFMDTAFKRRWDFQYLGINENLDEIKNKDVELGKEKINWNALREAINEELLEYGINEDKLIGPYFISKDILEDSKVDTKRFEKIFKNKVLMYLFDDVAKHKRSLLFEGCPKPNIYFEICKTFETKGINIFSNNIIKQYYEKNNLNNRNNQKQE